LFIFVLSKSIQMTNLFLTEKETKIIDFLDNCDEYDEKPYSHIDDNDVYFIATQSPNQLKPSEIAKIDLVLPYIISDDIPNTGDDLFHIHNYNIIQDATYDTIKYICNSFAEHLKKIIVRPDQFSENHIKSIVNGKFKDGDEVLVELNEAVRRESPNNYDEDDIFVNGVHFKTLDHEENFDLKQLQHVKLDRYGKATLHKINKEEKLYTLTDLKEAFESGRGSKVLMKENTNITTTSRHLWKCVIKNLQAGPLYLKV
jgi:hypothetical protein